MTNNIGKRYVMLESIINEANKIDNYEWQRKIIKMEPEIAFSGKTTIGNHKIYRRNLLLKIFKSEENSIFGMTGEKAIEWVLNQYSKKKTTDENLLKFLKKNVGKKIVEREWSSITLQKEGDVCVIPKDKLPEHKLTKAERFKNITSAWKYVIGSTIEKGSLNANEFMNGSTVEICSDTFAEKMRSSLLPEVSTTICKKLSSGKITLSLYPELINTNLSKKNYENLIFWLRWNSWSQFEKVVLDNTDLVNFPSEWDCVCGTFWRRVNQNQKRFEEIYSKEPNLELRLEEAARNNGELLSSEDTEEESIDIGDYDF